MLQNGSAWFLLADGRRARVLIEPRRGATLQEPEDWDMEIGPDDLYDPQDRPPRSFDRVGAGRHAMDKGRSLHEQEEHNFLKRVADRIGEAERHHEFDHLVVAAPPRALGILRELLPASTRARIRAEAPKDLLDEDAPRLRERLQDLLRH
jgi:protein required for attachment to host cells